MRDPQRIVDEIQAFLMASDQTLTDRHPELAREYKEACEEINKRLVRCAQLLRQGLRADAIHSAEAEPNLLTAIQTLDFSDRVAWLDVVGIYQLASPPDLEHGVAEHLSAAYTEHDPQRNLLRKHRRLALARAPLRERLGVIRELARIDSTNPIWDDDRKTYEMARFKQIQTEAGEAVRGKDAVGIEALEDELLNDSWSTRPPNQLLQAVKKAADTLRQESARQKLPGVEALLNDAFSALDLVRARVERSNWISLAEAARLSDDHPMRERVEPALIWIDKEEEKARRRGTYDQAVARLAQALDDPTSAADHLERLYAALVRAEQDLSDPPGHEALAQRYRIRVANLELAAVRRRRLAIGSGVAAALVIGLTFWMVYRSFEQASIRKSAAESIDKAIASGRVEEVEEILNQFAKTRPELLTGVEILSRMPTIEKLRNVESSRRLAFSEHLREAEDAAPTGKEPPAIEAARKIARSDEEKRSVESLARQIDRRDRDLAIATDKELLPALDAVSREIDAIESAAMNDTRLDPDLSSRLTATRKRFEEAVPTKGPLSDTARKRSDMLTQRINTVYEEIERLGRQFPTAEKVTSAVRRLPDDAQAYLSAITERASVFKGEIREVDLKKIIVEPERPIWEAAIAWSRQAREWSEDEKPLDPEAARRRLEYCRGYLKQFPMSPDAVEVGNYINYLEAISRRTGGEGNLRDRLIKSLSNPSIDPLYMIRTKIKLTDEESSQRHYCASRVPAEGTISGVEFRISSDGNTKRKTLAAVLIVGQREISPQSQWARSVKTDIASEAFVSDWDSSFIGWAKKAASYFEMDPICKLMVIRTILEIGTEGSPALREALAPTLDELKKADALLRSQWLDPDQDLGPERRDAERIVARLPKGFPDWIKALASAKGADARIHRASLTSPRPVGWLERRQPGWRVRFSEPDTIAKIGSGGWELVVGFPNGKGAAWLPLGPLMGKTDGAVALDRPEMGIEGRLVFLRSDGKQKRDSDQQGAGQ